MPIEINTPDKLEYQFFPARGGLFTFKVRSPKDAHLALTPAPEDTGPIYEIFLGGWENTKSVIRKNRQKPEVAQVRTPGILNANEFRGFWVRWYDNVITVGREGTAAALLSYDAGSLFPVKFVGICTGWGASGSWQLDGGYLQSKTELEDWVSELPEEYYSNRKDRQEAKDGEITSNKNVWNIFAATTKLSPFHFPTAHPCILGFEAQYYVSGRCC
uniref:C3 and PZP-like alpha-2-macroglobulin domain-containing protein 8 isoform X2 n=1 Tax=Drosophila rhopaloa TaxID=1041015 RepID=A0A6P4E9B9_DRORH